MFDPVRRADAHSGDEALLNAGHLQIGAVVAQGRLRVVRKLGEGGMGSVFEAFDRERRRPVALKTLHQLGPTGIYQLKNEFRSLAEVHHRNLVALHELFCDQQRWFFTMDLVDGEPFDRWVRPAQQLDEVRLRSGFSQLIEALSAIHDAGKLHRDVKPSNVLVNSSGHLVVLDFGLVVDGQSGSPGQTLASGELAGTPSYMAPEQVFGHPASTSSDWYAVGVMLYEALSGRPAFEGTVCDVLVAKQCRASPRLAESQPRLTDLEALCNELLATVPEARPNLARLRASFDRSSGVEVSARQSRPGERPAGEGDAGDRLVGRDAELSTLREAYAATVGGACVMMSISGESGVGKTALCQTFLHELRAEHQAVVLCARCYEHESVPFKALDPLIDELTRYMRRQRGEEAAALLPRNAFALVRLFPVLARVPAFAQAPVRLVPEPREQYRLALDALTELLVRLRDRQPLVIYLDDLQWTDADSVNFLRQLLVSRDVVPIMLLTSHRLEDQTSNPLLSALIEAARSNPLLDFRRLSLAPLTAADTEKLASRWLGQLPGAALASSEIAIESRGNPFFTLELARFASENSADAPSHLTLAQLVELRMSNMSGAARALLRVLALTGQPLPPELLFDATGADHVDLTTLQALHLARGSAGANGRLFECYHDRLRDVIAATTSVAERTSLFQGLTRALEQYHDPELLSRCLEEVGRMEQAAEAAALAARRAAATLAFDRAVTLYRRALALGFVSPQRRNGLIAELAEALENAGQGREAAEAYRTVAASMHGEARLDCERRAAQQLLETGHLDEGLKLLRIVCINLGLRLPSSAIAALVALSWSDMQLRARAFSATRHNEPIPNQSLRLKTLRTAVTGLVGYLPVHSASSASQYLLEALSVGDSADCVRALGFHAYHQSQIDPRSVRALEALTRMDRLAEEAGSYELRGFASLMHGTSAYHREECRLAREHFSRAKTSLSACSGVEWEHDAIHVYDQMSALTCGDYADIARTTPGRLEEALRRGRVWAATFLVSFAGMPAWLCTDDVASYRQRLDEVRRLNLARDSIGWPDLVLLYAEGLLSVYVGDPKLGFERFGSGHAKYKRSFLARKATMGAVGYAFHRGRCAASALRVTPQSGLERREILAGLSESIEVLQARGQLKSRAIAGLLSASLSFNVGARDQAERQLRVAIDMLDRAHMRMHLAAARIRLAGWIAGEEGRALREAGEATMRAEGVQNLDAMTELNCPGLRV